MSDYEIPDDERPEGWSDFGVRLKFERDWCAEHLDPLRETWPAGGAIAMVLLFDAFVKDPRVEEMAPKDESGRAYGDSLGRLVAECSPLCCFVGDEIVNEIVGEALAGAGPRLDEIKRRRRVL